MVAPELKQAFYSSGVHLTMVSVGTAVAFTANLIPALMEPSSEIKIDLQMSSLIAAMPGISGVVPILLLGPLMHYCGRKIANMCIVTPICIGWILAYCAAETSSITMLLAARFLQGLALGTPYFISVCIGEFSAPKTRSVLLGIKPLVAVLGISLMHLTSYYLHWKHLALVGAIPPALAFLVTLFWPETPEWLVSRARYKKAEAVFYSLRGYTEEGKRELTQMTETEKARRRFEELENKGRFAFLQKMKSRVLWKPVGVLFFAVLIPTVGGRTFIPTYSLHLAAQLSGDKTKGYFYTVVGDVIALSAGFLNIYLLKVFSRRHLLFGTGFLGFALLAACSGMLYIRTLYPSQILSWLILSFFAVYYFVGTAGFFPVSYILMGEIFPLEYRAVGSVVDGTLGSLGTAAVLGIMPWLEKSLGTHGMLLVFGCIMLLNLIYLYFELPETKNRTLHDVGEYFRGKSPKIRRAEDAIVNLEENRTMLER
ncbi:facilitated trehalose transporter Tret1-like isoform X1 [Choristoneura fumiferana]|uniref:facilitated trehalose transporter Tret1-like isoform X1 n=2 Tax=Choristoneura fumiferana TaxID=7141 RepID=UPI003D157EDE